MEPDAGDPTGGDPSAREELGPHALLVTAFGASVAVGASAAVKARGGRLPERIALADVVLLGAATQKLSRTLTKDRVTRFLRAPFTEAEGTAGRGEVEERPRGRGLRRALGELLVCPYCLGQWIAAALVVGLVAAPRPTRLLAGIFAVRSVADVLQLQESRRR